LKTVVIHFGNNGHAVYEIELSKPFRKEFFETLKSEIISSAFKFVLVFAKLLKNFDLSRVFS
jgi:hypothetical protein